MSLLNNIKSKLLILIIFKKKQIFLFLFKEITLKIPLLF